MAREELAIGLMSGTSTDGIDAALIAVNPEGHPVTRLISQVFRPFSPDERQILLNAARSEARALDVKQADITLGEWMADAVQQLLQRSGMPSRDIRVIGCHGHTVAHYPDRGISWQIGNPHILAQRTKIGVVSDFRQRDVVLGGQGAPFIPYYDYLMFRDQKELRVLLNLGGIANITVLFPNAGLESVQAWDTGPANMILDGLLIRATGAELLMDTGGRLMAAGCVHSGLLKKWLQHPYFSRSAPKSTGREEFGEGYIEELWNDAQSAGLSVQDMLATAGELIAVVVGQSAGKATAEPFMLIAAGGGTHNAALMQKISRHLPLLRSWETTRDFGVPEDIKEAMAFGYFGWAFLERIAINMPSVTGAQRAELMGSYVPRPGGD
jgi:anhydro-N-acetylmuramic acid kinase